jgi:8-oxo-dGTP pyrophosphatase MutT (NUDIX family)
MSKTPDKFKKKTLAKADGKAKTRRRDYYHDPQAPQPTSRKPSASVVARDDTGRILMLQRTDNDLWTIPTGGLKTNETITECGIRECHEETECRQVLWPHRRHECWPRGQGPAPANPARPRPPEHAPDPVAVCLSRRAHPARRRTRDLRVRLWPRPEN